MVCWCCFLQWAYSIRFLLAKVAVGSSLELITAIYKICGGVVSTVMGGIGASISTTATLPDKIVEAIEDVSFLESIPLWLVSLLGSLLITVLLVLLVIFRLTGLSRRRRYGRGTRGYSRGYRGHRHR